MFLFYKRFIVLYLRENKIVSVNVTFWSVSFVEEMSGMFCNIQSSSFPLRKNLK